MRQGAVDNPKSSQGRWPQTAPPQPRPRHVWWYIWSDQTTMITSCSNPSFRCFLLRGCRPRIAQRPCAGLAGVSTTATQNDEKWEPVRSRLSPFLQDGQSTCLNALDSFLYKTDRHLRQYMVCGIKEKPCWKGISVYFFFFKFYFLRNLYTQHRFRTHNPEIQSRRLYPRRQQGALTG